MYRHVGVVGAACCLAVATLRCSLLIDTDGWAAGRGAAAEAAPEQTSARDAADDAALLPDSDADPPESFGSPVVLADGLAKPSVLEADETAVYWIDGDVNDLDGTIYRRSEEAEDVPLAIVEHVRHPRAMAIDPYYVYFTRGSTGGWTYVSQVSQFGGAALRNLASDGSGQTRFPALAIEGSGLAYVTERGGRTIVRCDTAGTGAFDVATAQPGVSAVVLRAPYVYWNVTSGIVRSNGQAPTEPEVFSTEATGITELAADDVSLYWATPDGKLRALRFDEPGASATVLHDDLKAPRGLTVDDRYVYWASPATGEVLAIPKSGGKEEVLATGLGEPYDVAVNRKAVFFVDRARGELVRVPKR